MLTHHTASLFACMFVSVCVCAFETTHTKHRKCKTNIVENYLIKEHLIIPCTRSLRLDYRNLSTQNTGMLLSDSL